jgi:hypothetical protein
LKSIISQDFWLLIPISACLLYDGWMGITTDSLPISSHFECQTMPLSDQATVFGVFEGVLLGTGVMALAEAVEMRRRRPR